MSQLNATRFELRAQQQTNKPSNNSSEVKFLARDVQNYENLQSIEHVDASTLPADVLVLLSKYSKAIGSCNGMTIQLSSLAVFKEVHDTALLCEDALVQRLHRKLLVLIRSHIQLGSMYLVGEKKRLPNTKPKGSSSRKPSLKGRRHELILDAIIKQSPYNKASNLTKASRSEPDYERSISILA